MISILTSFKPFEGDDAVRQRNALASWRALGPDTEIMAFAPPEGLGEVAREYAIKQVFDLPAFEGKLPRVDTFFAYGREHGRHDIQMYVNGDILLFPDFADVIWKIRLPRWMAMGQRTDVDVFEELTFGDAGTALRDRLFSLGQLHDIGGIDYFVWRRGSLPPLPTLCLGSAGWDNIFIYCCRRAGMPVIDATRAITVFHQNHDFRRLSDGTREAYEGPAARWNLRQVPDRLCLFYTTDASHWMDENGRVRSALTSPRHAWRMVFTWPILRSWPRLARLPFRLAAAVVRRAGVAWRRLWRLPRRQRCPAPILMACNMKHHRPRI